MQPPAQLQDGSGLPDFSGFNLVDSFAKLPRERTKLETLCEIRSLSLEQATSAIEAALQAPANQPIRQRRFACTMRLQLFISSKAIQPTRLPTSNRLSASLRHI
jgi:hypothetical protein